MTCVSSAHSEEATQPKDDATHASARRMLGALPQVLQLCGGFASIAPHHAARVSQTLVVVGEGDEVLEGLKDRAVPVEPAEAAVGEAIRAAPEGR
jgi:hypothetical protein